VKNWLQNLQLHKLIQLTHIALKRLVVQTVEPIKQKTDFKVCFHIQLEALRRGAGAVPRARAVREVPADEGVADDAAEPAAAARGGAGRVGT
jgi:hypothetical protein